MERSEEEVHEMCACACAIFLQTKMEMDESRVRVYVLFERNEKNECVNNLNED